MTLEDRIEHFFDNATTDEVIALLEECGIERYRDSISVPAYLEATKHLVTDRPYSIGAPEESSVSETIESTLSSKSDMLPFLRTPWMGDMHFPTFRTCSKRMYILEASTDEVL